MLKVFCILLILSINQSQAVLSNAQQDLAIKPIVHKQPPNQYLTANIPEISTDTQHLPTLHPKYQTKFVQNSSPYNYNPPFHQYLPSSAKEEITSTPRSYTSPLNHNTINQYQPNYIPSNFNGPLYQYYPNSPKEEEVTNTPRSINPLSHHTSLNYYQPQYASPSKQHLATSPQEEVLTTPRSNIPTSTSTYYGPAYEYLPATTRPVQTTTSLPNTPRIQNSGNFNNFSSNHKTHWTPITESRPYETTTHNIPSNVQPPIELHHGYRYIEPALKVNSSNFQTINGVIYNELGLGQNETNTTQKPHPFLPQNLQSSKTEIESQQGYVYGSTQYNPHYPNTTVLIPVQESTGPYNYYQPMENHNRFDSKNQNLKRQQSQTTQFLNNRFGSQNSSHQKLGQQDQGQTIQSTQSSHYQNNKFGSSNQNLHYQQQTSSQEQFTSSSSHLNHKYSNSNHNSQQTTQFIKAENNLAATTSVDSRPTENINRRPSSQSAVSFNDVNLISHSNNIASPQPNRYTTEITQQMATQIYPNIHTLTQTTTTSQHNSPISLQIKPSNYDRQPQPTDYSNANQNYASNLFGTSGTQSISQQSSKVSSEIRPSNYEIIHNPLQSTDSTNCNQHHQQFNQNQQNSFRKPNTNLQTESNQYLHHNSQTIAQIRPIISDLTKPSISSNNPQFQSNRFDTSSPLSYPSINQNLQNTNANSYYLTNSQQSSQAPQLATSSDIISQTQSNRLQTTETQNTLLPNYSLNQNQQNRFIALSSSLPNVHPESFQGNITSQSLLSSFNRPIGQIQANRQDTTQQSLAAISSSNTNQQNRPITSHISIPTGQIETNPHYSNSLQQTFYLQQQQPEPIRPSHQHFQSSLTKPNQQHSNFQTDSNQHYFTNSNRHSQSLISSNSRPELNQFYSTYPQQQPQNTYGNHTEKPSTNFASNAPTESNHNYYYNKPQQSNIQTDSNGFFANIPQPSKQNSHPSNPIQPLSEASNTFISPTNSQTLGNRINFASQQLSHSGPQTGSSSISSNTNNPLSSLSETPRYTTDRQSFFQNLQQNKQSFLAKPFQTHQVPSANSVSNFFGQTSAVSTTAPLPENSNGNIISPTLERQPLTNLMANSNFIQMQSQSFEIPYYNNKPLQLNDVVSPHKTQKPLVFTDKSVTGTVEPPRLPHLKYGTPIRETSNTYLPPSITMQSPYYKK